uniref:Uncharacterized protein n=1 Tax=Anguilla anguilla TaxID=7936 RepID=A0A0E9PT06_ANGAN
MENSLHIHLQDLFNDLKLSSIHNLGTNEEMNKLCKQLN